jgi:3-hydroxyisobutyrate dehydrogenase-like beta-hydroxyacid dehydrogenase
VGEIEAGPIGVIGLGSMGGNMANALIAAGHQVVGYDLDGERVRKLVEGGGVAAPGIGEVAERCPIVLVSVPATDHLQAVAAEIAGSGADQILVIDASTVDPAKAREAARLLEDAGHSLLRSPVSGSTALAASGNLVALCSGTEDAYRRAEPLLEAISGSHVLLGPGDVARVAKLVVNVVVIGTMGLIGEAVRLGEAFGMPRRTAMEVINRSVAASVFTAVKTEPVVERDFTPTGSVDLVCKDLSLMRESASSNDIELSIMDAVEAQFLRCQDQGWGAEDFAIVSELPR